MVKILLILIAVGVAGYFGFWTWKRRVKIPSDDKLTEAKKQGLISDEEVLKLKYERAKERYEEFLKKIIKKKK